MHHALEGLDVNFQFVSTSFLHLFVLVDSVPSVDELPGVSCYPRLAIPGSRCLVGNVSVNCFSEGGLEHIPQFFSCCHGLGLLHAEAKVSRYLLHAVPVCLGIYIRGSSVAPASSSAC